MTSFSVQLAQFFSVNTIAFTVLGYPMSYVELLGTIFNLWSVWLVARNRILTWPVGIIGVLLFLVLFYQIQLYSDTLEQVYYLFASFYGWWVWSVARRPDAAQSSKIRLSSPRVIGACVVITGVLSLILGYLTARLHLWLPTLFPTAASFAYLDALTTIMSFTATILMAQRRVECWGYWLIVDVIGIGLYYAKDVKFIALLYVVFLVLAAAGLIGWLGERRRQPMLAPA